MASENDISPEPQNKSFASRLWELPVAVATMEQLSQMYSSVKERNAASRITCNGGESAIQMANAATNLIIQIASSYSLSKPIVGRIECAAATIDRVASETLAKVEEKCPIITKTPDEIKTTITDYYNKVQNHFVVKMGLAITEDVLSISELMAEVALPTDGTCEEDMKELETADEDIEKGALVRAQNLTKMLTRRGKRKLMTYRPVKFSIDAVGSLQQQVTDLIERSTDEGKKVYNASMYIPRMAFSLSGELMVSVKQLVLAFNKTLSVQVIRSAVAGVAMRVVQPLSDSKGNVIGHVFIPPQLLTEYLLSSRPFQWFLPPVSFPVGDVASFPVGDVNKKDIPMEEIEDTTESEGNENEKESA